MKKILCAGIAAAASLNLYAAPLVFNWQQHQAEVTETIQSADNTITTRYRIRLLPQPDNTFLLHKSNAEMMSINGTPPAKELKTLTETLYALAPDLVISKEGMPLDIPQWDAYYRLINHLSNSNPNQTQNSELDKKLSKALKLKTMQEPWCYWVCLWAQENPATFPLNQTDNETSFGLSLIRKTNYQLVNASKNNLTLKYTATLQPAQNLELETVMENFDHNLKKAPTPATQAEWQEVKEKISKRTIITAQINAQTLQPGEVKAIESKTDGNGKTSTTIRLYQFRWLP